MTASEHPGHDAARPINQAVKGAPNFPQALLDTDLYGQFIASLVHFVDGTELRYLGAKFATDEHRGEVVAFTDTLAIRATITGGESSWEEGGDFTAEAFPRSTLTSMAVHSHFAMFDPGFTQWPGRYRLKLTYAQGAVLTVPPSDQASGYEFIEVEALRPSLRADLEGQS